MILFLISSAGLASMTEEEPIEVGLAFNIDELRLAGGGETVLLDLGSPNPKFLPWPGDHALITAVAEQIQINDLPVGSGPLLVFPTNSPLAWEERNYRGEFLIINQNGKLNLINRLPLEDYLRGVVPKEIPAGWPMAALKAQAIAARTYTLANLERHREDGFRLCATTHCQVYQGLTGEHPNTDRAVAETRGMVVTYEGELIAAVYHDSSGGYTKDAAEVWSRAVPYLIPAPGWDSDSPYHQWARSFDWEELQGYINKAYPEIGELRQLLPAGFGGDGRVIKLTLKGSQGEIIVTGEQFRHVTGIPSSNMKLGIVYGPEPLVTLWWLRGQDQPVATFYESEGFTEDSEMMDSIEKLPDPWTQVGEKTPLRLEIRGAGRGHGVGLSQWGAKGMAEAGYSEKQILEHFYPGATVTNLAAGRETYNRYEAGVTVPNVSQ
ncbi:MAG: SpoIID/LytB domain-containing protein [Bacteroidota bacterium]